MHQISIGGGNIERSAFGGQIVRQRPGRGVWNQRDDQRREIELAELPAPDMARLDVVRVTWCPLLSMRVPVRAAARDRARAVAELEEPAMQPVGHVHPSTVGERIDGEAFADGPQDAALSERVIEADADQPRESQARAAPRPAPARQASSRRRRTANRTKSATRTDERVEREPQVQGQLARLRDQRADGVFDRRILILDVSEPADPQSCRRVWASAPQTT